MSQDESNRESTSSMLTPELETAIRGALDDATRRGHEFSALEHLLLALLGDEKTADVIKHCGGSINRLNDKLEEFLGNEIKALPEEDRERASPTLAFARVVQRAVNHVLSAGRSQASGSNVLVAMFSEPESHAEVEPERPNDDGVPALRVAGD